MSGRGTFVGICSSLMGLIRLFSNIAVIGHRYMDSNVRLALCRCHLRYYDGIITLEFDCKTETTIITSTFPLQISGIIADIITIAMPSNILSLGIFLRIEYRFHSYIIETVRFKKIDNIEPIFYILPRISNREVIPLRMPIGIEICRQNEIILEFTPTHIE